MEEEKGKVNYRVYRSLSYVLYPFLYLQLQWHRRKGLEHPFRWPERLGRPSCARPPGPLLWFHSVSIGEGLVAIPVIKRCIQQLPNVTILLTTTRATAFDAIEEKLPDGVIHQFSPLDTPAVMDAFLDYWKPNAIMLMECELWPNLILGASKRGIVVALLNARISESSYEFYSRKIVQPLVSLMLSKFSLIAALSTQQAIRYQMLEAPPLMINVAGDLKFAIGDIFSKKESVGVKDLQLQLNNRRVWMASSIHEGEEQVMLGIHKTLMQMYPDMLTIIVPRFPTQLGPLIASALQRERLEVVWRSRKEKILPSTDVYVADTLGELQSLYKLTPIAFVGGSLLPGLSGHNISEAAAAGCAVLTGHHIGCFTDMVLKMKQTNPLSVLQVSGKADLLEALNELFGSTDALEARRLAAKQAFLALSSGVTDKIWDLLDVHVIRKAIPQEII